jgi:hypothetical protein
MFLLLAVVVIGTLLGAAVVSATQSALPPVTEEDRAPQLEAGLGQADTVIGDDPDENGYSGPMVSAAESVPAAPSEAAAATQPQDLLVAPGPDQQGSPDAVAAGPEWTNFYYFFAAGSSFRPRDSATGWDYQSVGCISARGGNDIFTLHLEVPHGARIDYLRILYYDTSATNTSGYITSYNAQGAVSDLIGATSTGNGGYGYVVSNYLGHVVNTESNAYILNWIPGTTGSTMRLCGLRVAYRLPS